MSIFSIYYMRAPQRKKPITETNPAGRGWFAPDRIHSQKFSVLPFFPQVGISSMSWSLKQCTRVIIIIFVQKVGPHVIIHLAILPGW